MYQLIIAGLILFLLSKILNVNNYPEKSQFYCANKKFLDQILRQTPSLSEPFSPTRLWGFSGHIQTIIQSVLGHIYCPLVDGKRLFFIQPDGSTVTYDLFQPIEPHSTNGDYTLALCPGIGNSSESVYIRRAVHQAQNQGYRVAVLNHLGALKNVPITSSRIFCYGNTLDYHGMIKDLLKRYPGTKFVCVGFSMGGNLVTKYLGEQNPQRPNDNIIAGISVCQGYDAVKTLKYLLQWENCRRLYLFVMTENMRTIIRRWQKQLFPEELKKEKAIAVRDIWSAATLWELDEAYTRKVANCKSVDEYYRISSCCNYFENVTVPMVFINALDDPIVPVPILEVVKEAVKKNHNFLYIEQKYGGHLGFYDGGLICPKTITWLDRNVVNLADSLIQYSSSGKDKINQIEMDEERMILDAVMKTSARDDNMANKTRPKKSTTGGTTRKLKFVVKRKGTIHNKSKLAKIAI